MARMFCLVSCPSCSNASSGRPGLFDNKSASWAGMRVIARQFNGAMVC